MSNKKITLFIAGVLMLIIITVIFFIFVNGNSENSLPEQETVLNDQASDKDKDATIQINTEKGAVVVNNVYNDSGEVFEGGVTFEENKDYSITYSEDDHNFALVILNPEDLKGARIKAEDDFLKTLGIDKEQACGLSVTLAVPYDVKPNLTGKNYGLSFCPDGKSFEEIKGL